MFGVLPPNLDLTHNPEMYYIFFENSDLQFIDFSQSTNMYIVFGDNNQLTSVDFSNCPSLYTAYLSFGQIGRY